MKLAALSFLIVCAFSGCGLDDEEADDTESSSATSVTENCPVDVSGAESAEEAVDAAEDETGGEAVAVEETGNEAFRVYLKNIEINNFGCGEVTVTVTETDTSISGSVE